MPSGSTIKLIWLLAASDCDWLLPNYLACVKNGYDTIYTSTSKQ